MDGWVDGRVGGRNEGSINPQVRKSWKTQDESSLGHAVSSASASLCVKSFRATKDTG